MPIKKVLISHAQPADENSPYQSLIKDWHLEIDFLNFMSIEGLPTPEFRKQNIHPLDYTAVIFTGKNAVDHFFRIAKDLRVEMPPDMKYFCVSESTAKYLQKYIVIRKRKLFVGEKTVKDLFPYIKKNSGDKYLYPGGEIRRNELSEYFQTQKYSLKEAMVYQTVPADLSPIKSNKFDLICFYSPASIEVLFQQYPDYQQGETRVAVFGESTARSAEDAGLRIDIMAPAPGLPSMTMAIEHYLKQNSAG